MSTTTPEGFGVDIYIDPATEDADALWSTVTGVALVRQDLRIRILTETVLGPGGDDYGEDVRNYVGMTADQITSKGPALKRAILKDQRIDSVDVIVAPGATANGTSTAQIDIRGKTALGPFRLVFLLDPSQPLDAQVSLIVSQ